MGPHQGEPSGPVEVDPDPVPDGWRLAVAVAIARLELVEDLAARLPSGTNDPRPAVVRPDDHAAVGRLPATTRIEDGAIQGDQRRFTAGLDRDDSRLDALQVGVRIAELLARGGHAAWRVTRRSGSRSSSDGRCRRKRT